MPTNYAQINDYSDELGTTHGLHLDQDFTAVAASIATVTESLSLVQRGDGRLQDVSVEIHTISPEVLNLMGGFNLRGLWAPATAYAVNDIASEGAYTYVCKTAHTSGGSFSETNWIQFGFTTGADAAAAAAAAQVSAASALASANTATTQAGIATTNASTTTTNASTSTTNATNANNSAIAAAASAASASGSASAASSSAASATISAAAAASVVAPAIHAATTKATPVDADELPMSDSAASWAIKKFTWANLKSVLKSYFDALYIAAGAALPYIYIREEQALGTNGGTFTSGAWRTRTLNTSVSDAFGFVSSLSANRITLGAGTYRFRASAPANYVNQHQTRLYNVTDAAAVANGTSAYASTAAGMTTRSTVTGRFTIGSPKAFELQHYCTTTQAANGFGVAAGFVTEVYSEIEFWRE
jgi:hypothetical protein